MLKPHLSSIVIAWVVLLAAVAMGQGPARNIGAGRHPNLAAAQRFSHQAFDKIVAAQQANEWDMQGHAQKAKDLRDQASNE